MSFLQRIFGDPRRRETLLPLYTALVAAGRDPAWYRDGGVPDTLDGRFDMIAALTAIMLLRLEDEGEAGRLPGVLLTEIFVEDMEGTLRQIGIGDYVVSKHLGRMMSALGGRLEAFRAAAVDGDYDHAVRRNIFHEAPPSDEALALVSARLARYAAALAPVRLDDLLAGRLPTP